MNVAAIRGYLRETIEFFVYFVFMTGIGAAMYVLVTYAPQANSGWYINTCIGMALFSGIYAVRMYRRYRRAMRRLAMLPDDLIVELAQMTEEERRALRWSERIAAERLEARGGDAERVRLLERLEVLERAYRERCAALGIDPDEEGGAFTIDPNMTVDAIRSRIADRMLKKEMAEEESARPPIFRN
ncbi:hypothetical protein [uncultured Sphingomonas sp.]|uniref:hypothetical protein n=1 Tax=uncultured Sphingomonas sp. TaxID=158754 RepID=UPI0025E88AB2|nr:hypothetical protein [uncultured Sphingomonas sp.]